MILISNKKTPGMPMSRIPFKGINKDTKRTRKYKPVHPRKTTINSLKKKGPIFP
jgi:hypothetical protein